MGTARAAHITDAETLQRDGLFVADGLTNTAKAKAEAQAEVKIAAAPMSTLLKARF